MHKNVASVDGATCTRLLKQYAPLLQHAQRQYRTFDQHELRAVWEDALLEAYLTLDTARATEGTWVRRVFAWRLAEFVERELDVAPAKTLGTDPRVLNGVNPEEAFWAAAAMAEVLKLDPNTQTIVVAYMSGYTYAEVADQVGVSWSVAKYKGKRALNRLQRNFGLGRNKERT